MVKGNLVLDWIRFRLWSTFVRSKTLRMVAWHLTWQRVFDQRPSLLLSFNPLNKKFGLWTRTIFSKMLIFPLEIVLQL